MCDEIHQAQTDMRKRERDHKKIAKIYLTVKTLARKKIFHKYAKINSPLHKTVIKMFRQYMVILSLCFIALNFYALKRYDLSYPFPLGPKLDKAIRQNHTKAIIENAPQIVLIGDSTLIKGVDTIRLSEQLDIPLYSIGLPGSASTLWYLIIKNNVITVPVPPKYLLIFFRDTMLTMPGYRVQGQYLEQIDEYASPKDELLIERAYIGLMNPMERFAEAYIPIYTARWQMREEIESQIRYTPAQITGCAPRCVDGALSHIFGESNMSIQGLNEAISSAENNLYTHYTLDFENEVHKSFLPELIRMAHESNIQLVLIRMKTLQFTQPFPALDNYMNNLKTYAQANNVIVLDFTDDPRLPSGLYMDTLHLNDQGKVIFTDILTETLKPLLH